MHAVKRRNLSLKGLAVAQTDVKTTTGAKPGQQLYAVEHALLRFGAEPLHRGDFVVESGLLEGGHGIHAEFVGHEFDALRAQAGNAEHLDETGRCFGVKVNPIVGPASFRDGLCEGTTEAFADTLHVVNLPTCHQFTEVFAEATEHSAGVLVGANSEDIGALKFEQHRHLMQHIGHLIARKIRRSGRTWLGKSKGTACHTKKRLTTLHKGSLLPPCSRTQGDWQGHGGCGAG